MEISRFHADHDLTLTYRVVVAVYTMDHSYERTKAIYDTDVLILPPSDADLSEEHILRGSDTRTYL
jgi:hypothetical protein